MDEHGKIKSALNEISRNIRSFIADRGNHELCEKVIYGIAGGAEFWVGKTSVGIPKNAVVRKAFQEFWTSVFMLIQDIGAHKKDYPKDIWPLAECVFRGKIYRFINTKDVKYDSIYVSWSKSNEFTPYMGEKLGIRKTYLITAETGLEGGIDLEKLGASRPNEREVVFPTSEDSVISIEKVSK